LEIDSFIDIADMKRETISFADYSIQQTLFHKTEEDTAAAKQCIL